MTSFGILASLSGTAEPTWSDYFSLTPARKDHPSGQARSEPNARVEGEDVVMVAARLVDVDDLNRRARYVLRDECNLGDDRVVLAGRGFAESDDVLALRNDYRLGLLNGTRATVQRIDISRHEMILATTTGDRLTVPFAYVETWHLTHSYATTIHKAQGAPSTDASSTSTTP